MSKPWEPFDPAGRPVGGDVLYELRADPGWLRGRLAMILAIIAVVPFAAAVASGAGLVAYLIAGAVVVVCDVAYAAWWRGAMSPTRLRITTAEGVLEGGRGGAVRIPVGDVESIDVLPGGTTTGPFGALVSVMVTRESDGETRGARTYLPADVVENVDELIQAALDRAPGAEMRRQDRLEAEE